MNQDNLSSARRTYAVLMGLTLATALALSGCLGIGESSIQPEVTLTMPQPNATLSVGQSVRISGTAKAQAIARVDIIINDEIYAMLSAPDKSRGEQVMPIEVPWTPLFPGTYTIQVKVYAPPGRDADLIALSEPVIVMAELIETPTKPPTPTQPPTTQPPVELPPPADTPTTQDENPSVTVTGTLVNVRKGPDVSYQKIGELRQGQTVLVRGRSADGRWWQIAFPSSPDGLGWVIGMYVRPNPAAANVPIVAAPPRPTATPTVPTQITLIPPVPTAQLTPTPTPAPQTVGSLNVLRVERNPVPFDSTAFAFWNIPNFRDGEFDKGDGRGFIGPIAQSMRVDIPNVTSNRVLRLRWRNLSGVQQEDTLMLIVVNGATVECNEANPDWRGRDNPQWTFCRRRDLEYVGDDPGPIAYVSPNRTLTLSWDVYGIREIFIVFESNDQHGPRGEPFPGKSFPTTGKGSFTFKAGDIGTGCFKVTLRLVISRNPDRRTDFGDKRLCIGVPSPQPTDIPILPPMPIVPTPEPVHTPIDPPVG